VRGACIRFCRASKRRGTCDRPNCETASRSEVSDALVGYEKLHQVRSRQQNTVADLQETVRISTLRYRGGTTTYLEVLDGQRPLFAAELTLASARGDEYRGLVQLYKALGGGWQ
jgi:outer membrane protein, multidrug efflux system